MEERGSRLQALCELYRYSQRDLAAKAGISQMAISKLIHGKSTPRMDTLEALARAFALSGTELYEILTGRQPVPTEPRLAAFRQPAEHDSALPRSRKGKLAPDAATRSSALLAEPVNDDTVIATYLEHHPDLKARLARLLHEQPDTAHQLLELLLPAEGAEQPTNERTPADSSHTLDVAKV